MGDIVGWTPFRHASIRMWNLSGENFHMQTYCFDCFYLFFLLILHNRSFGWFPSCVQSTKKCSSLVFLQWLLYTLCCPSDRIVPASAFYNGYYTHCVARPTKLFQLVLFTMSARRKRASHIRQARRKCASNTFRIEKAYSHIGVGPTQTCK